MRDIWRKNKYRICFLLVLTFIIYMRITTGLENKSSSIAIIGGADGPTAIYLTGNISGTLIRYIGLIIVIILGIIVIRHGRWNKRV